MTEELVKDEDIKDESTQSKYTVTGGAKPHTFGDLGAATRLALILSEKYVNVITVRKEGSDEVYKYTKGKEINNTTRKEGSDEVYKHTNGEESDTTILDIELNELSVKVGNDIVAVGAAVTHKKFGCGTVLDMRNGMITVRFADGEKRFQMPQAFEAGFLELAGK